MRKLTQNIADYIRETDKLLLLFCLVASLFGCALVYSATRYTGSTRQFFVQLVSVFIGIFAAIVVSLFDYRNFSRYTILIIIVSAGLLGFTYFFGYAPQGTDNRAWIELPMGMSIQPSELIKIFFTITFSAHVAAIDKTEINKFKNVILLCLHGKGYLRQFSQCLQYLQDLNFYKPYRHLKSCVIGYCVENDFCKCSKPIQCRDKDKQGKYHPPRKTAKLHR